MNPWLMWPIRILASPLFLAIVAFLVVLFVIGSVVEIVVAAVENRRPQLPPASHADGTPLTWTELVRGVK